jgi:hypothetical protein
MAHHQAASGEVTTDHKLMVGPRGKRWIGPPGHWQTHPDGNRKLVNGKPVWKRLQWFEPEAIRKNFDRQVLAVLRAEHPELFEGEPER